MTSNRMPNGACIRGPAAWITWQAARDVLLSRLGQLERDPSVHRGIVRGFRNTIADLELAAHEYRDWERSGSAADSAEVSPSGVGAVLESSLWVGTGLVAEVLGCSPRWVTALCVMGRLSATRVGREWRIDPDSVEDFKKGIAA